MIFLLKDQEIQVSHGRHTVAPSRFMAQPGPSEPRHQPWRLLVFYGLGLGGQTVDAGKHAQRARRRKFAGASEVAAGCSDSRLKRIRLAVSGVFGSNGWPLTGGSAGQTHINSQ